MIKKEILIAEAEIISKLMGKGQSIAVSPIEKGHWMVQLLRGTKPIRTLKDDLRNRAECKIFLDGIHTHIALGFAKPLIELTKAGLTADTKHKQDELLAKERGKEAPEKAPRLMKAPHGLKLNNEPKKKPGPLPLVGNRAPDANAPWGYKADGVTPRVKPGPNKNKEPKVAKPVKEKVEKVAAAAKPAKEPRAKKAKVLTEADLMATHLPGALANHKIGCKCGACVVVRKRMLAGQPYPAPKTPARQVAATR